MARPSKATLQQQCQCLRGHTVQTFHWQIHPVATQLGLFQGCSQLQIQLTRGVWIMNYKPMARVWLVNLDYYKKGEQTNQPIADLKNKAFPLWQKMDYFDSVVIFLRKVICDIGSYYR